MSKTTITVVSLSVLIGCGGGADKLTELPPVESAEHAQAIVVNTVSVRRENVARPVLASGATEAVRAADLGPQLTARVDAVLVEEGDHVKTGAPLVRLDVVSAKLRQEQTAAQVESQKTQYELAKSEYERLAPLVEQGTITPQQRERLASQRDALKSAWEAASVASADAKHTVTNALVRAPFAGVVSRVLVEVGEVATMAPPKVLVRLVDLSSVDVRVHVHERQLGRLARGSKVVARFPSTGESAEGSVQFISPEIDPRTRSAEVVTRIPNPEGKLRSGMFTEIAVAPSEPLPSPVVPTSAVGGTGEARYVFAIEGGVAKKREVRVSAIDASTMEVLEGVRLGEVIVADGLGRLSDGSKVSVATADNAAPRRERAP